MQDQVKQGGKAGGRSAFSDPRGGCGAWLDSRWSAAAKVKAVSPSPSLRWFTSAPTSGPVKKSSI
jgi:hypothetical protein